MPDINKITEVLYDGNQPYHVHYDNLPLKNILTRIDLVNAQVDINTNILRGCAGSVGTLSNRLSASIEDNGKLKSSAVDISLHNIGYHSDGVYDGIEYVRMTKAERDKLETIESESNKIEIEVEDSVSSETQVDHVFIYNGYVRLKSSDTIAFQFIAPDTIKAHSKFTLEAAHIHHYEIEPSYLIAGFPDYINFKTTSANTAFREGSLRVYVNGFKLNSTSPVRVLTGDMNPMVLENWKYLYIASQSSEQGLFSLNSAITSTDIILIDFDQTI
jgi:hypothetical protein